MASDAFTTAARGSVLRTLRFVASIVVGFLLTPFVIHTLGDRSYGFWILLGSFFSYYEFLDLGMGPAFTRHLAGALGRGDREGCRRFFSAALKLYPILGVLAFATTCVLAVASSYLSPTPEQASLFAQVILVLGTTIAVQYAFQPYSGVLAALGRFDTGAGLDLLTLILQAGLVWAFLTGGYGISGLAWASLVASLPRIALTAYLARRALPWLHASHKSGQIAAMKELFGYSFFMMVAKVADNLRFKTDSVVITAFLGLASVTPFGIALSLTEKYRLLMMSLLGVLQPVYSRLEGQDDWDQIRRIFFFATKIAICVSSFVGFVLVAWGAPFIERWIGTGYRSAYDCLVVLAIGWTVNFWQSPSVSFMYATSRHKFYAATNILEAGLNVALSVWWVHSLGLLGVALGTAVPMILVRLILQPHYTCKLMQIDPTVYRATLFGNVSRTALALAAPAAIALAFRPAGYPQLVISVSVAAAVYASTVWFLLFSAPERMKLLTLVPVFGKARAAAALV